jgi:uncharacterized protein (DUF934 family)
MANIIRDGAIVQDDWIALPDDAEIPTSGRVILSLKRWQETRDALKTALRQAQGDREIGVRIPNTADVVALWDELKDRPLIAVEFPAFGDGRAFSQAAVLRERFGYKGEIRAVGDVLRDQIFYMQRCGIDAMVPRADQDLQGCVDALKDFTTPYQSAADDNIPIYKRRAVTSR